MLLRLVSQMHRHLLVLSQEGNKLQLSSLLLLFQLPSPTSSFQVVQSQLNRSAENLNIAANDVVGSCRGDPSELALSSNKYTGRFDELLDAGINMAAQWKACLISMFRISLYFVKFRNSV